MIWTMQAVARVCVRGSVGSVGRDSSVDRDMTLLCCRDGLREGIVEVIRLTLQVRVLERIVEQAVVVPVPEIQEHFVEVVGAPAPRNTTVEVVKIDVEVTTVRSCKQIMDVSVPHVVVDHIPKCAANR